MDGGDGTERTNIDYGIGLCGNNQSWTMNSTGFVGFGLGKSESSFSAYTKSLHIFCKYEGEFGTSI